MRLLSIYICENVLTIFHFSSHKFIQFSLPLNKKERESQNINKGYINRFEDKKSKYVKTVSFSFKLSSHPQFFASSFSSHLIPSLGFMERNVIHLDNFNKDEGQIHGQIHIFLNNMS